mmetsp:Transcript_45655/g.84723  ORF Transcript_45655/g.84723 Transcript_45655/m.84723 type:complete len:257 (-) Transcript_45655:866-1636(-)
MPVIPARTTRMIDMSSGLYRMKATEVTMPQQSVPTINATMTTAAYPSVPMRGSVDRTVVKIEKSMVQPPTRRAQRMSRRSLWQAFSSLVAISIISGSSYLPLRIIRTWPRSLSHLPKQVLSMAWKSETPYLAPASGSASMPRVCWTMKVQSNPSWTNSYTTLQSPFLGSSSSGKVRKIPSLPFSRPSQPSTESGMRSAGTGRVIPSSESLKSPSTRPKTKGSSLMISSDRPNPPTCAAEDTATALGEGVLSGGMEP